MQVKTIAMLYNSGIECDPRLFLMYICINSLISIEYVCVTCCAKTMKGKPSAHAQLLAHGAWLVAWAIIIIMAGHGCNY